MIRTSILALFAFSCLPLTSVGQAPPPSPTAPIEGLWAAERTFGPEISGPLTLWRSASGWQAEIAGYRSEVHLAGDLLKFHLPGDRGSFRGRWHEERKVLDGHWIQPATTTLGAAYATPIRFHRQAPDRWQGEVDPLVDRIRLYLRIFQVPDERDPTGGGTVTRVVLRNPERNLGIRLGLDRVVLDGTTARFLDRDGETVFEGHVDGAPSGDQEGQSSGSIGPMRVHLAQAGLSFDFVKVGRDQASGFYPAASDESYDYRAPLDRGDGWPVIAAEEAAVDPAPLVDLVRSIQEQETTSVRDPYIHSILVARGGKLVLEEYFYGHGPAIPHDTRSAGKSLGSMIAGAAFDRYPDLSPATTVVSVFGQDADEPAGEQATGPDAEQDAPSYETRSAWRRSLTIGHLLSMRSGLDCDDNDWETPANEDRMQSQDQQPDWALYALAVATTSEPGTRGVYCSAGINLGAATVARATGRWLPEAFAEWIAEPLAIEHYHMNLTPTGEGYLGGGVRLVPRDQLKLGQVMLDGGRWQGRRVLSQEWVADSLAAHAGVNEPDDYGYGWWRIELENPATGKTHQAFHASGNGGQLVIVVPDFDLVVQFSGGNYSNFPVWIRFLRELVPSYVLPAVDGV